MKTHMTVDYILYLLKTKVPGNFSVPDNGASTIDKTLSPALFLFYFTMIRNIIIRVLSNWERGIMKFEHCVCLLWLFLLRYIHFFYYFSVYVARTAINKQYNFHAVCIANAKNDSVPT